MSIYEYDYEKHMQMERAEAREDGMKLQGSLASLSAGFSSHSI